MSADDVAREEEEEEEGPPPGDASVLSVFSDEGLDLSQRIGDSFFAAGRQLHPDVEELVVGERSLSAMRGHGGQ